jgi:hypothetical protein
MHNETKKKIADFTQNIFCQSFAYKFGNIEEFYSECGDGKNSANECEKSTKKNNTEEKKVCIFI